MTKEIDGASLAAVDGASSIASDAAPHVVTVEIDPDKWYRGQSAGSCLLREDGRQCCIGLACSAAGIDPTLMRDTGVLTNRIVPFLPPWGRALDDNWRNAGNDASRVYPINDDPRITSDTERVDRINADLARNGIPLRFVLKTEGRDRQPSVAGEASGSLPSAAPKDAEGRS